MSVGVNIEPVLKTLKIVEKSGEIPTEATGISQDSRLVRPGYIFAARPGDRQSGLNFIAQAREQGAVMVLCESPLPKSEPLPFLRVAQFHPSLAALSRAVYRDPSGRLRLIGITGTNGKTTTTYLIKGVIEAAGAKCALLGTVGYYTGARQLDAPLTTPDIDRVCELLGEAADFGCTWGVIEVSSHSLDQGRVEGLNFTAAGFTNLTQDHLDYHGTMEKYAAAKARLFKMMNPDGLAAVNASDRMGRFMLDAARGRITTFGPKGCEADLVVTTMQHDITGGRYKIDLHRGNWIWEQWERRVKRGAAKDESVVHTIRGISFEVQTPLVGVYHGMNIALAAVITLGHGFGVSDLQKGVSSVRKVPGRMEAVEANQPFAVFVDYSHTPDALERALASLRPLCRGALTVVFGCGGNHDKTKRPEMGRIAAASADLAIITSDNPRSEEPEAIIEETYAGIPKERRNQVVREVDRRSAINLAVQKAAAGDVVLIAGKGHETYQEARGVRSQFDDVAVAMEVLLKAGYKAEERS